MKARKQRGKIYKERDYCFDMLHSGLEFDRYSDSDVDLVKLLILDLRIVPTLFFKEDKHGKLTILDKYTNDILNALEQLVNDEELDNETKSRVEGLLLTYYRVVNADDRTIRGICSLFRR